MKLFSDQVSELEIIIITRELKKVLQRGIAGDVLEFGCYIGTTSVYLQEALLATNKQLHVYDSFQGLPEKTSADLSPAGEHFKPGELHATKKELIRNFRQSGMKLPVIHSGWFSELTEDELPGSISFMFLDGDYYESILMPLRLAWPKMMSGSVVVVDDYLNEKLPGVKKAIDTWAQDHSFTVRVEAGLAIINVL